MIHLISAVGRSGQLGLDNKLPWHCPEDLKWFKEMTMGQVVVVGHNTAETLPPLPGRKVYCMARGESPKDVIEAFDGMDLWVIGGAKTYAKWLPYVDRFHINVIDYAGPADAYMPPLFAYRLHMLLNKHGICTDCGDLYEHDYEGPFASCSCKTAEWHSFTPHMRKLRMAGDALAQIVAYDRRLDSQELPPTGEDYNALMAIVMEAMR